MNRIRTALHTLWPWLKTLLLVFLILWSVNTWRTRETPQYAPNFSAPLLNGETFRLQQFRQQHPDQAVALIFWAEWCPICRTEEHSINRLVNDPKLLVIPVATQSGSTDAVQRVLGERGHRWNMLLDEQGQLLQAFGLVGVPTFLVIDTDGRVRHVQTGYTSEIGMRVRLWLSRF